MLGALATHRNQSCLTATSSVTVIRSTHVPLVPTVGMSNGPPPCDNVATATLSHRGGHRRFTPPAGSRRPRRPSASPPRPARSVRAPRRAHSPAAPPPSTPDTSATSAATARRSPRPIRDDAPHQQLRTTERDAQTFTGQRIHIARRVTHQQHSPRDPASYLLPQRARRHIRTMRMTPYPLAKRRELRQMIVERTPPRRQHRDPHTVVGHRRHVRLRPCRPMHFNVIGPRRDLYVPPDPPPPRTTRRHLQPQRSTQRRVKPVRRRHVPRPHLPHPYRRPVLADRADVALHHRTPATVTASKSAACKAIRRTPRPAPDRNAALTCRSPSR